MSPRSPSALAAYQQARHAALSPRERILYVLQIATEATEAREWEKARKAIAALRGALDYSAGPEIALGLERLYTYCDRCLRAQDQAEALRVLASLTTSWKQAGDGAPPEGKVSAQA